MTQDRDLKGFYFPRLPGAAHFPCGNVHCRAVTRRQTWMSSGRSELRSILQLKNVCLQHNTRVTYRNVEVDKFNFEGPSKDIYIECNLLP
ncbi:hypothetical protein Mapa_008534 [Marchantia paleacea]|nr:hypothetical protein Mapa_008534 [Marchantia paleacea]